MRKANLKFTERLRDKREKQKGRRRKGERNEKTINTRPAGALAKRAQLGAGQILPPPPSPRRLTRESVTAVRQARLQSKALNDYFVSEFCSKKIPARSRSDQRSKTQLSALTVIEMELITINFYFGFSRH